MLVMRLDQHVEAKIMGGLVEGFGEVVVDGRHDDEDAVGAPGARLQHLIGVEQKILAQDRKRGRLARLHQMLGRPLKRGRVGQDRKTRCAARLIGLGERGRLEILAYEPLRRTRLLDLRDQAEAALLDRPLQRFDEAARRGLAFDLALQGSARHPDLSLGNFTALVAFNLFQDVGHGRSRLSLFDAAIKRSSVRRAAPERMAASPMATPSWMEPALPATTSAAPVVISPMSR